MPRKLEPAAAAAAGDDEVLLDEKAFRFLMNADVAATTKLAEGINAFVAETAKLKAAIEAKVNAPASTDEVVAGVAGMLNKEG